MEKGNLINAEIVLTTRRNGIKRISLEELVKTFMPDEYQANISSVTLRIKDEKGRMLHAGADLNEPEYPGILLDAEDSLGEKFCLAQAELPNPDSPKHAAARLYAGNLDYEYDRPIAKVMHEMDLDPEKTKQNKQEAEKDLPWSMLHKIVYVDRDMAQYRPWCEDSGMPEHVED